MFACLIAWYPISDLGQQQRHQEGPTRPNKFVCPIWIGLVGIRHREKERREKQNTPAPIKGAGVSSEA